MAALLATRSLRVGLVTATPPTPLRRGGGGGARTCATRRSIRRVARKGVGFGVRVHCKATSQVTKWVTKPRLVSATSLATNLVTK
eukprot:scaffold5340_cov131-Isochrysis_galbana.AAC.7